MENSQPDIFLSIGTGRTSAANGTTSFSTNLSISVAPTMPPTRVVGKSFLNRHLYKSMKNRVDNILDTERAWSDFQMDITRAKQNVMTRYRRLNPILMDQPPRMDEIEKLGDLQQEVRKEMRKQQKDIRLAAHQLVASSFFFEKSTRLAKSDPRICEGKETPFKSPMAAH